MLVTCTVVRTALRWLEQRGLVSARRNIGWFIRAPHQMQGSDRLRSFTQWAGEMTADSAERCANLGYALKVVKGIIEINGVRGTWSTMKRLWPNGQGTKLRTLG